jgi:ferredoxin
MPTHAVTIVETEQTFRCPDTRTVLEGMECVGRRGIPVGCRGGGCGVCKVEVVSGTFEAEVMSAEHVSASDLEAGRVLACRVRPTSDLVVRVLGRLSRWLGRGQEAVPTNLEIRR